MAPELRDDGQKTDVCTYAMKADFCSEYLLFGRMHFKLTALIVLRYELVRFT